jgi:hypothetical protein
VMFTGLVKPESPGLSRTRRRVAAAAEETLLPNSAFLIIVDVS